MGTRFWVLLGVLSWGVSGACAELDRSALVKFSESAQKFYERSQNGTVQDIKVEQEAFSLSLTTQALLKEWDAPASANQRDRIQSIVRYLRPNWVSLSDAVSHAQNGQALEGDLKMLQTFIDLIEGATTPAVIPVAPPVGPRVPAPNLARLSAPNFLGAVFVSIPAGTFMMGSPLTEVGRGVIEAPQHQVTLSQSFEMQTTPVTQAQWRQVMGSNPSHFRGDDRPVEKVSWNDVQDFIAKLNQLDSKFIYRLPTEAEWEYAARGGTQTAYFFGDDPFSLGSYAWLFENRAGGTRPVGQKKPNPFGLYDIYGNVSEWVQDGLDYYPSQAVVDPVGPKTASYRMRRGCSWVDFAEFCRSATRFSDSPEYRLPYVGFRLVRSVR